MASTLFLKEPLPYCLLHYSTPFTCSALIYPISWDLALLLKAQLKNNKNKVQRDLLLLALMSATVWIAGELVSAVLQHIMGKVCQELLQLKQNKPYAFQKIIYDFMQRQAYTDERGHLHKTLTFFLHWKGHHSLTTLEFTEICTTQCLRDYSYQPRNFSGKVLWQKESHPEQLRERLPERCVLG